MIELVRTCPSDFKEYYVHMQAAKRVLSLSNPFLGRINATIVVGALIFTD
jgi:hypothetical protein